MRKIYVVRPDGGGAGVVPRGGSEVVGRQPEGAACADPAAGGRGRAVLDGTGKSRRPTRAVGRRRANVRRRSRAGRLRGRRSERKRRASPPVEKRPRRRAGVAVDRAALGAPPPGYANWSLRLLARRAVELEIVESLSHETVRRTLKKNGVSGRRSRLGDSAGGRRRVRGEHGAGAGRLREALRRRLAGAVHGRAASAAGAGDSTSDRGHREAPRGASITSTSAPARRRSSCLCEPLAGFRRATARPRPHRSPIGRARWRSCWRAATPAASVSRWCPTTSNTHTRGAFYEVFEPARAARPWCAASSSAHAEARQLVERPRRVNLAA